MPQGRCPHGSPIAKGALTLELIICRLVPILTSTNAPEQLVHGGAIATRGVVPLSEAIGQMLLIDGLILPEHGENGERHLCIIRVRPGLWWEETLFDTRCAHPWGKEKSLAESVTNG